MLDLFERTLGLPDILGFKPQKHLDPDQADYYIFFNPDDELAGLSVPYNVPVILDGNVPPGMVYLADNWTGFVREFTLDYVKRGGLSHEFD